MELIDDFPVPFVDGSAPIIDNEFDSSPADANRAFPKSLFMFRDVFVGKTDEGNVR